MPTYSETLQKILTSDAMILAIGLSGYFYLESTEAIKNINAFFLDCDKEMRIKRQGRYAQLSVLFFCVCIEGC